MSVIVEARQAGGRVTVGVQAAKWAGDTSVVILVAPGGTLDLSPDESRRLAVALIEHAAVAERGPVDDDWTEDV